VKYGMMTKVEAKLGCDGPCEGEGQARGLRQWTIEALKYE
jgi:hypothetical protein